MQPNDDFNTYMDGLLNRLTWLSGVIGPLRLSLCVKEKWKGKNVLQNHQSKVPKLPFQAVTTPRPP